MHNTAQLRSWWGDYLSKPNHDFGPDLVETVLLSKQVTENSPISTAEDEATNRVCWFKRSVWTLGLALLDLGALGWNVLSLTRGK